MFGSSESGLLLFAQSAAPQPNGLQMVVFFTAITAIMYFLVIRPGQKDREQREQLLESLVRDAQVVTQSGIHGKVVDVQSDVVVLEIAPKVKMKVDKTAIARRQVAKTATGKGEGGA